MRLTKKVAGTFVQKAVWTKTLDVKHYTKFTVTKDLSVLHVTDFVWGNHRPASVPSVSRADPVRATAGGNHCKSPPCLTCPQSGRKVLRSDVSTSAALWSVMSGIISRVLPSTPICAPPPEDLIEEWRDGRGLKALWGENGLCVCIRTVAYHLMCCHSSACGCVWMSVWPGDGRTAGCVSVARSSETFWRNRANQELRLLFNCRGLWALQLQFFTFWFYFDMIFILSWKYLWIHMTWSSNTMFISVLAFCQDTEKHSQKPTPSWHRCNVKGHGNSLSQKCTAANKPPLWCWRQFSSLCEIHNTDGLEWDQGETASHRIKISEICNSSTWICQISIFTTCEGAIFQAWFAFCACSRICLTHLEVKWANMFNTLQ